MGAGVCGGNNWPLRGGAEPSDAQSTTRPLAQTADSLLWFQKPGQESLQTGRCVSNVFHD